MKGQPASTVRMDGRVLAVERIERDSVLGPADRVQYRLTGARGASYTTMRNAKHPAALFVLVGSGRSPRTFWFTDARGELEPVDSMGAALAIVQAQQARPDAPAQTAPAPASAAEAAAEVKRLERELAAAQAKSTRAMEARMGRPPGTSRARATTLNANWARAAEHRDRISAALDAAKERLQSITTTGEHQR